MNKMFSTAIITKIKQNETVLNKHNCFLLVLLAMLNFSESKIKFLPMLNNVIWRGLIRQCLPSDQFMLFILYIFNKIVFKLN